MPRPYDRGKHLSSVRGFEHQTRFRYPVLQLVNSCELVLCSSTGSLQFSEVIDYGPQYLKLEYTPSTLTFPLTKIIHFCDRLARCCYHNKLMENCLSLQMAHKKESFLSFKISFVIWFLSIIPILTTSQVKLNNICCCLQCTFTSVNVNNVVNFDLLAIAVENATVPIRKYRP